MFLWFPGILKRAVALPFYKILVSLQIKNIKLYIKTDMERFSDLTISYKQSKIYNYIPLYRVVGQSVVQPDIPQGFYPFSFCLVWLLRIKYQQSLHCLKHSKAHDQIFSPCCALIPKLATDLILELNYIIQRVTAD